MAVYIKQTETGFELAGSLHASHAHEVRRFFEFQLGRKENLNIELHNLEDIDLSSVMMLDNLRTTAQATGCELSISTGFNDRIMGPFRQLNEPRLVSA